MSTPEHKSRSIVFIGVDVHGPRNEMAGNIIAHLSAHLARHARFRTTIISIQLDKPASTLANAHVVRRSIFGKAGQLIRLIATLISISERPAIVHYVGNGNRTILYMLSIMSRFLGYRGVVSFLSSVTYQRLPPRLVYTSPDPELTSTSGAKTMHVSYASPIGYTENNSTALKRLVFASVPRRGFQFEHAGLDLIRDAAPKIPSVTIHVLNRFDYLQDFLDRFFDGIPNIVVEHGVIKDIRSDYRRFDAFLITYKRKGLAESPMSLIEGITLGKPVLVSSVVSIGRAIEQYNCGIRFAPDAESLASAIHELKYRYCELSAGTHAAYNAEFSPSRFCNTHVQLYETLISRKDDYT